MPRYRPKAQVKANLELWLNNLFLSDGFYNNVVVGDTNIYGADVSTLIPTSDESYADNRVWRSPFLNWVHESGIIPPSGIQSPIIASGAWVNGTFYPKSSGAPGYNAAFAHSIDYPNGRIIFDSPILSTSQVSASFSYKTIGVDFVSTFENEQRQFYIETTYKDNPSQTGVISYPEAGTKTLPMVVIDMTSTSYEPYELGSASNLVELEGSFWIWARDSYMLDQIEDLVGGQEHSVIQAIDFNTAPYPLDEVGDKNEAFTSFGQWADVHSPYFWRRIYLDEIDIDKVTPLYNIERSQISFLARVYPNF